MTGRTLDEVYADFPEEDRAYIDRRLAEIAEEIDSLKTLREIADRTQEEVARRLDVKQPTLSRIEKQADVYLSTLAGYVEALGGELKIEVTLPGRPQPLRLLGLGGLPRMRRRRRNAA